jgi:hypothetical protein
MIAPARFYSEQTMFDHLALNDIVLAVIALLNAYTAFKIKQTHDLAQQVETKTNSMQDQLIKKTGEAAHAAGVTEGIAKGDEKAAVLAQGRLEGEIKKD